MRLIDAEPMEDQVKNTYGDTPNLKFGLLRWIAYQPTVDAVPLSDLLTLRDWLYEHDAITMEGLAQLNQMIAIYKKEGTG